MIYNCQNQIIIPSRLQPGGLGEAGCIIELWQRDKRPLLQKGFACLSDLAQLHDQQEDGQLRKKHGDDDGNDKDQYFSDHCVPT